MCIRAVAESRGEGLPAFSLARQKITNPGIVHSSTVLVRPISILPIEYQHASLVPEARCRRRWTAARVAARKWRTLLPGTSSGAATDVGQQTVSALVQEVLHLPQGLASPLRQEGSAAPLVDSRHLVAASINGLRGLSAGSKLLG